MAALELVAGAVVLIAVAALLWRVARLTVHVHIHHDDQEEP